MFGGGGGVNREDTAWSPNTGKRGGEEEGEGRTQWGGGEAEPEGYSLVT